MQKEENKSGNNTYYGVFVCVVVILLLNAVVFPKLMKKRIVDTDYGTFIEKIESGKIPRFSTSCYYGFFLA